MIEMAEIDVPMKPPLPDKDKREQSHSMFSLCLDHCVCLLLGLSHNGAHY